MLMILLTSNIAFSQEMRIVAGTMKDDTGEPLPGVSIMVKGTTTGTVTDMDGKYSIKAPLGSTVVFSFVGFMNKEMVVTYKNSSAALNDTYGQARNPKFKSSYTPLGSATPVNIDTTDGAGATASFSSKTPSYAIMNPNYSWWNDAKVEVSKINDIDFRDNKTKINLVKDEYYHLPHVTFFSSLSAEMFTRLPEIQKQYAQGRPQNGSSVWRGPETGEILSWGPKISQLEFDGNPYSYDIHGSLVAKGTGSGVPAKAYSSSGAFKNGYTFFNSLKIFSKTDKKEYSVFYSNKLSGGILPGMSGIGNRAELNWKRSYRAVTAGLRFNFDNTRNNYLSSSPSNPLLMASILTTPPTFDITNGESARKAYKTMSSYQISDNQQRSYAAENANHPYWLLHHLRDKETVDLYNALFNLKIKLSRDLNLFSDISYQHQNNKIRGGYTEIPLGVENTSAMNRDEDLSLTALSGGAEWNHNFNRSNISSVIRYDNYESKLKLERYDSWLQTAGEAGLWYKLSRIEHNINWNTNYTTRRGVLVRMSHNISGNNRYKNNELLYAPTFALGLNLHDLLPIYEPVSRLKIKSNWGYSYANVPLSYAYGRYNYQDIPSSAFYNTSFSKEVFPDLSLKPEKLEKKDVGIESGFFYNKISLELDVYENTTHNAIYPVLENNTPVLKNMATTRVRGIDAEMMFYQRLGNECNAQFRLTFDHYKSRVMNLNDGLSEIPVGGFADVHTSLVKGYPAGVVVGTSWLRDDRGNLVIDDEGYPMVDNDLKVIANPDPDFNMGLEMIFSLRAFTASVLMEYRHGGEVWNGTSNVLSYYGLSKETVEGRKVLEYIFEGVKEDGTPNTTPVDFANPSNPLTSNRWYRYGLTGVAEDAVEDASCFRIREISVSYIHPRGNFRPEFTIFARNPLLITKYSGTDPAMTLWEQANTRGLDLFNNPSFTSLGFSVKLAL
jgi:hypothetical protein